MYKYACHKVFFPLRNLGTVKKKKEEKRRKKKESSKSQALGLFFLIAV
jgi:hypothetical protein